MTANPALQRLIKHDLYNELRWMLVSASVWQADIEQVAVGDISPINHLRVFSMDSSFIHIRALYDFFIDYPNKVIRTDTAYAKRDFGVSIGPTALYSKWIDGLNKRAFHLDVYRPKPTRMGIVVPGIKINKQIVLLSQDVLNLWDNFTNQCPDYSRLLKTRRSMAIEDAEAAARSRGIGHSVFN